jgi:hypothetical protein
MGQYLHCFDKSDKLKCLNFCSRQVIESLLALQLIVRTDNKPNPRNTKIENLTNCKPEDIDGLSSPRMSIIYQASINRSLPRPRTDKELAVIKKADLEIEFERRRRELNYGAASRLSCVYLVDNTFESKLLLQSMFADNFKRPKVVEVDIVNNFELTKCDVHWVDKYFEDPKDEYIVNYWTGVPLNENYPTWEYLLEGTIQMTNRDEIQDIIDDVKINFPTEYQAILTDRQNLFIN